MTAVSRLLILILSLLIVYGHAIFHLRGPILLDPPDNVDLRNAKISANLYFEQKVDHFNPTDTRKWKQRYHVNEDYFNETSKNHVFLLLAGEWEATERWLNYGAWIETANQYGALLIYLEHRFYGVSQPFSDLSTGNLQYLSSHQALEDAANFIQGINNLYNLTSEVKWIVFGGSYAGTLAAWLRQKYPHLVAGAMSSSAPLKAILDFSEYLQVVRNGMATHSETCVDNIKIAYSQLEQLTSSCLEDVEVYQELNEMFKLCDNIQTSEGNEKDLATLFQYLTDSNFAHVVQYNGRPGVEITIDTLCDIMVNETGGTTELQRLAQVNSLLLQDAGDNCTDYKYTNLVAKWQNTTIDPSSMMRQWVYQTCTEFGFFQTSSQKNPIFGSRFDVTFFTDLCIDVFGDEFNDTLTKLGIQATNNRYGATDIATSNIVYFHGTIDPWHVLGKLENSNKSNDKVIIVNGVAHCANMQAPNESDPVDLTAARKEINNLIGQWLGITNADPEENSATKFTCNQTVLIHCILFIMFWKAKYGLL